MTETLFNLTTAQWGVVIGLISVLLWAVTAKFTWDNKKVGQENTKVAREALDNSKANARALDVQKNYSDVDSLYFQVLQLAVKYPDLIDRSKTTDYKRAFTGSESRQYGAYAYIVWNVCETIYDRCKCDPDLEATWEPVIHAENGLHREWLTHNKGKFKPKFWDYVMDLGEEPEAKTD